VKRGKWSHLGYGNTRMFFGRNEKREYAVAKVWRLGVPGKCWQHPQAGSTFARNQ